MSRRAVQRRIVRIAAALDPLPDQSFLAYARALIEFGGGAPTAASVRQLARYFAQRSASTTSIMDCNEGQETLTPSQPIVLEAARCPTITPTP